MPVLLDTGALELLRRRDQRVENLVLRHYPPVLCPHVAGEFLHHQLQAPVSEAALTQARTYVAAFEVLEPTARTAEIHARLRAHLAARDIPLCAAGRWIAAHALEQHLPLLTTERSFRQVPRLKVHLLQPRFIRPAGA